MKYKELLLNSDFLKQTQDITNSTVGPNAVAVNVFTYALATNDVELFNDFLDDPSNKTQHGQPISSLLFIAKQCLQTSWPSIRTLEEARNVIKISKDLSDANSLLFSLSDSHYSFKNLFFYGGGSSGTSAFLTLLHIDGAIEEFMSGEMNGATFELPDSHNSRTLAKNLAWVNSCMWDGRLASKNPEFFFNKVFSNTHHPTDSLVEKEPTVLNKQIFEQILLLGIPSVIDSAILYEIRNASTPAAINNIILQSSISLFLNSEMLNSGKTKIICDYLLNSKEIDGRVVAEQILSTFQKNSQPTQHMSNVISFLEKQFLTNLIQFKDNPNLNHPKGNAL